MEWILTDDATMQHALKVTETKYRLIDMALKNPDTETYSVYMDDIELADYLDNCGNADGRLIDISKAFGYESVEHVKAQYGEAANQIICECIFETLSFQKGEILFTGTRPKCEAFISDFVSDNLEEESISDPSVTKADMYAYGYKWDGMIPLRRDRALELFDEGHQIFRLYINDAEGAIDERCEIDDFDGLFGVEDPNWDGDA